MRISDWSSDVCSSDLEPALVPRVANTAIDGERRRDVEGAVGIDGVGAARLLIALGEHREDRRTAEQQIGGLDVDIVALVIKTEDRVERPVAVGREAQNQNRKRVVAGKGV